MFLAIVRNPDRDGVSPIPVPREAPVFCIDEPVVESFLLHEGGNPGSLGVLFDEILLNVGDLDEPTVEASINQRCLGAPAEGVAMLDCAARE